VVKRHRAREVTDDNLIQRKHIPYCITKTTDTHSEYVILIVFHGNDVYVNALQGYDYAYIGCIVL
jgi:hypothetical protein